MIINISITIKTINGRKDNRLLHVLIYDVHVFCDVSGDAFYVSYDDVCVPF